MERRIGFYEKYIKRPLDITGSLAVLLLFSWLYAIIALLVRIKLGSPVLFVQPRPGKDEKIFNLYKFRTMTDEVDASGKLLPDSERLTPFGKKLRETSLDELPEAFNILKGEMSFIGPRPLLVRDMVFMTPEQRTRHCVRPGLSGLAQVNGRNAISWEDKLSYDVKYAQNISLFCDLKIILLTIYKAFITHAGINEEGMATAQDFGDYLLDNKKVTLAEYQEKMLLAKTILINR